ncbi:hypothetical protein DM02DRAFT_609836, partial [Periconia macrospinosa]
MAQLSGVHRMLVLLSWTSFVDLTRGEYALLGLVAVMTASWKAACIRGVACRYCGACVYEKTLTILEGFTSA